MECDAAAANINGYIFDLDGVLTDTMDAHARAWGVIADELGVPFGEADLKSFRGLARAACLETLFSRMPDPPRHLASQLLDRKADLYRSATAAMGMGVLFDGVRELLVALRQRGVSLAVASASREAWPLLAQAGIAQLFDVVSDGHFDGRPKPAPDQVLSITAALGMSPERTVVFDDSWLGIEAAQSAGALAIGVGLAVNGRAGMDGWVEHLSAHDAASLVAVVEHLARNPRHRVA